jgi:hypothetical protein
MEFGDGLLLVGGMTDPYFHTALDPGGSEDILRANIYEYAASFTQDWA